VLLSAVALAPPCASAQQRTDLRVMSFNIRVDVDRGPNGWPVRRDKVVKVIDDFNPDVLGMQEDTANQAEYVVNQLPRYSAFGRSTKPDGSGEHNSILYRTSRFTELQSGTFWLSETPDVPGSRGWKARIPRAVNWVELEDNNNPGFVFVVMNTHWENGPKGAQARLHSATLMREMMADIAKDVPVVFTADFNADEGSAPYQRMTGRDDNDNRRFLIDSYRDLHPQDSGRVGTAHRFTGKAGRARIDWILHDDGFDTLEADIVRTSFDGRYPSDHFPITATLDPVVQQVGVVSRPTALAARSPILRGERSSVKRPLRHTARPAAAALSHGRRLM